MSTNKDYKSHTEDPPTHHLGQGRVLMQNTNYAYDSVVADVRYPLVVLVGLDLQSSPTE